MLKSGVLPLRSLLRRAVDFRVCRLELAVLAAMAANVRQHSSAQALPPVTSAGVEQGWAAPMLSAAAALEPPSLHAEHGIATAGGLCGSAACVLRSEPAYATPAEQPDAGPAARPGRGAAHAARDLSPGPATLPEQPQLSTAEGSGGLASSQSPAPASGTLGDEQAVGGAADRLCGGATCAVSPGPAPGALGQDPGVATAEGVGGADACALSPAPAPTAPGQDPGEGAADGPGGGAALGPAPAPRTLDENPGTGAAGMVSRGADCRASPVPAPRSPGSARTAAAFAAWHALTVRQWRRREAAAAPMARRTEWRCACQNRNHCVQVQGLWCLTCIYLSHRACATSKYCCICMTYPSICASTSRGSCKYNNTACPAPVTRTLMPCHLYHCIKQQSCTTTQDL